MPDLEDIDKQLDRSELFRESDAQFDKWFADENGISASLVVAAYQGLSPDEAREIADELHEIADWYEEVAE